MKRFIMSVRDRAADTFGQPFFVPSVGVAVRSFADEVNRGEANNQLYAHPEDFDLYQLGTFNDENGSFDCHEPRQVAIGKDVSTKGK